MDRNNILKIVFIIVGFVFLFTLVTVPKTHCDACKISHEGREIDGYDAWSIFERDCISYAKPWDSWAQPNITAFENTTFEKKEFIYVDIDCINSTYDDSGMQNIDIDWECADK